MEDLLKSQLSDLKKIVVGFFPDFLNFLLIKGKALTTYLVIFRKKKLVYNDVFDQTLEDLWNVSSADFRKS